MRAGNSAQLPFSLIRHTHQTHCGGSHQGNTWKVLCLDQVPFVASINTIVSNVS